MALSKEDQAAVDRVVELLSKNQFPKEVLGKLMDEITGARHARMKAIAMRDQAIAELRLFQSLIESVAKGGRLPPEPYATILVRSVCCYVAGDIKMNDGDRGNPYVDSESETDTQ
jgi:hypothetical protein